MISQYHRSLLVEGFRRPSLRSGLLKPSTKRDKDHGPNPCLLLNSQVSPFVPAPTVKQGKAFSIRSRPSAPDDVRIAKQLRKLSDRNFLIEEMHYTNAKPKLKLLPAPEGASRTKSRKGRGNDVLAALIQHLPFVAKADQTAPIGMKLAKLETLERSGFLCDYGVINPLNNFTFLGNTNYWVIAPVGLTGRTVIEGGTVVKSGVVFVDNTDYSIALVDPAGTIVCQTEAYKPAVFTSVHDNTIGEILPGSTGSPQPDRATALFFYYAPGGELHDLRFTYAQTAIQFWDATPVRLLNSQIVNCGRGIVMADTCYAGNVLIASTPDAFDVLTETIALTAENLTLAQTSLRSLNGRTASFVNCIFNSVEMPEQELVQTACAYSNFESAGAGAFYLPPNSANRNCGVVTIDAALKKSLSKKTTYPPILVSNVISAESVTLFPQAQRDTDAPDLGYHYPPIDYLCSLFAITNATSANDVCLTMTNGVVVGYFDEQGILLRNSVAFTSIGTPTNPNRFVDYRTVQEQPVKIGTYPLNSMNVPVFPIRSESAADAFTCRFTHFSRMSGGNYGAYNILAMSYQWFVTSLVIQDCEFLNGAINVSYGATSAVLKNNVMEYNYTGLVGNMPVVFANNTLNGGVLGMESYTPATWEVRDNILSSVIVDEFGDYTVSHHHNVFVNSNPTGFLTPITADSRVLTSLSFVQGSLGNYYVPANSPVLNVGTYGSAASGGLFHQTMTTDQAKDGVTPLDIGKHYVVLGADGSPIDGDNDGLPDYLEDWNGDGVPIGDASPWEDYNSANKLTSAKSFEIYTPLYSSP